MAYRLLSRVALACAILGVFDYSPAIAERDEFAMLQMPHAEVTPTHHNTATSPAHHHGHKGALSHHPNMNDYATPEGTMWMPFWIAELFNNYRMMACLFVVLGLSALFSACLHGQFPVFKARSSKDKMDSTLEQGYGTLEQSKSDSKFDAQEKEKAVGIEDTASGPPAYVTEAQKQGELAQSVPPGTGMCCCSAGLSRFLKPTSQNIPRKDFSDRPVASTDSPFPPLPATLPQCSRVPFTVPSPPPSCVKHGHPDFSGTWACAKAEGQLDELMADFGLGYFVRSAAAAYSYGAGRTSRECEHDANKMKYKEMGLEGMNVIEYDIPCKDAQLAYHLRTAYWDEVQTHVLVIEGKDPEKAKPETWSTSWQYLVDENTFHIKSSSAAGHTATWIYKREVA